MTRRTAAGAACLSMAALAGAAWAQYGADRDPQSGNRDAFADPNVAAVDPEQGGEGGSASPPGGMSAMIGGGAYGGMMGGGRGGFAGGEEFQRAHQTNSFVQQWKNAKPTDRKALEGELTNVLTETFVARQAAHEKEVAALERKVRRLREQLDRRKERQAEIVDFRLKQLLREAEGLGWGAEPNAEAGMGMPGMMPGMGGMPGGGDMMGIGFGGLGGKGGFGGGAEGAYDPAADGGEAEPVTPAGAAADPSGAPADGAVPPSTQPSF